MPPGLIPFGAYPLRLLRKIYTLKLILASSGSSIRGIHQETPEDTLASGTEAMEKVIAEQTDVRDAMFRPDVGSIRFS